MNLATTRSPICSPALTRFTSRLKASRRRNARVCRLKLPRDVRADFSLQPGQINEVVTISEEVPLVNTTSATLGGTLSNKEINDLPLNGRNYENLLQLRPGVMRYPGGGFRRPVPMVFARRTTLTSSRACSTASLTPGRRLSTALASPATPRRFFRSTPFRNSICSRILRRNTDGSQVRWSTSD